MGLLLPAYGVGYVWLIRTARDDPAMYAEVEKHLKRLLIALQVAFLVVTILVVEYSGFPDEFQRDTLSLSFVMILLTHIIQISFRFFRRIAALPPKTEGREATKELHTEVQSKRSE